jgi:hypothetical protein
MQFALEVSVLECSFLKYIQRILGVNSYIHGMKNLKIAFSSRGYCDRGQSR